MDPDAFKGLARILAPSAGGVLADRALSEKLIQPGDFEACLQEQKRSGKPIDEILVDRGLIPADALKRLLGFSLPSAAAAVADDPARALNQYLLIEPLGSGGMADVWKAWDRSLCRWVAIKIMKDAVDHGTRRLEREGRTAGKFLHPNIIPVHEVGVFQSHPFLVMPLIDGRSLEAPLDVREAVRIVREMASALHHVHQAGVIHRDVKPANILLDKGGRPLLGDFGLAVSGDRTASGWTLSGTPPFASPEQLRGEPLDCRTDIYSLGATLFHLVAGHPPFPGRSAEEIREAQDRGWPVWTGRMGGRLRAILKQAMAVSPKQRYASMEEFRLDLDRFLERWNVSSLKKPSALLALGLASILASAGTYAFLSGALRTSERQEALKAYQEGSRLLREAERSLGDGPQHQSERRKILSQAIPEFFSAIWLMKNEYPEAGIGLGRCYELLGQFERAEKEYVKGGALPEARIGLARIGIRRSLEGWPGRDWKEWATGQLGGIENPSGFPIVELIRAYGRRRWEDVLRLGSALLKEEPSDDLLLFLMGRSAREAGHWEDAHRWLESARYLRGDCSPIDYQLGKTYLGMEQKEKAQAAFARAISSADPAWTDLPDAILQLEKLKKGHP